MKSSSIHKSLHINRSDWLKTSSGDPRGYIQPGKLLELWFHTGTICNLHCPFCLEGSQPGDMRLEPLSLPEIKPYVDEAVDLGVEKFSFTGGEPFVVKDMVAILDYVLSFRPCLVLTNATQPLKIRMQDILTLKQKPNPVTFRVSLDYPDPQQHDLGRGDGMFDLALSMMGELSKNGFQVSIARRSQQGENRKQVEEAYYPFLHRAGIPTDVTFVSFPDLLKPGCHADVPQITETCMTTYKTEETRQALMCHYSKMIVKRDGKLKVYACTLVDDDPDFDLGGNLKASLPVRIMLKHHRCYSCFASGASCSQS